MIPKSITYIDDLAFVYCEDLTNIYYCGTYDEWNTNVISECGRYYNIYYYSEIKPEDNGNYWHYVDGIPVNWEDN